MVSRILSLLVVVALVIGFAFLIRANQSVETEYLFGGRTLGQQEIDSVEMTFSRAKLNGWERDGRTIKIPTHARTEYLTALDGAALPMSLRSSVQEAIDKASLFEPTSQREARERHAKERDLGNKLAAFPEIRWASVEHDLGERIGLSMERVQSASVVVCPEGDKPLPPARTEMVRELIRGSYAGMQAEEVVVIDTNADPTICPTNDPIARKQCQEEARLEQAVQHILQAYGPIRIAAYIEMRRPEAGANPDGMPSIAGKPQSPAMIIQSEPDQTLLNEIIDAVTRVSSNRATRLNVSRRPLETEVSVSKVSPDQPTLSSVRLSIGIPESYYHKVWRLGYLREHPGKTSEDIPALSANEMAVLQEHTKANITTAVRPALISRIRSADFRGDESAATVDVWNFPDLASEPRPDADLATGMTWASQSWRPLAIGVLGCFVGWLLLGTLRSSGQRREVAQTEANSPPDASVSGSTGGEISDELTTLVDQNPELAADVIRNWIDKAA